MSLINEALKQANRIQQAQPAEAGRGAASLHPVEYRHPKPFPVTILLTVIITLCTVAGGWMIWQGFLARPQLQVQASGENPAHLPVVPPQALPETVASVPPVEPISTEVETPEEKTVIHSPSVAAAEPEPTTSVPEEPPAEVPDSFTDLKLSAILYSPTRPSVMISGKVLFLGDSIRKAKVVEIQPHFAIFEFEGRREKLHIN